MIGFESVRDFDEKPDDCDFVIVPSLSKEPTWKGVDVYRVDTTDSKFLGKVITGCYPIELASVPVFCPYVLLGETPKKHSTYGFISRFGFCNGVDEFDDKLVWENLVVEEVEIIG